MKILLYTNDIIEIKSHEHFIEIEQTYKRDQKILFFNDITQKYETSVLRHVELNNNKLYFNYKKKIWHRKLKAKCVKKLRTDIPIEIKDIYHLKEIVQKYDRYTNIKITCEKCNKTKIWKIRPCYINYDYNILMCPYCKEKYNNLQKYGVENIAASEHVKEKIKNYFIKKYNVENPSQVIEIRKKQIKKFFAPNGKYYDSSWEYLFEQYLIENNIQYTYQSKTTFKWIDIDGKEHKYIPDFSILIDDKEEFIEIKGDHFFDENGNYINPYDKSEKGYANAKLKWECMMKASVKIYKLKDLINLGIKIKY